MRPVYSLSCWNGGDGCPPWVKPYRLGGGAGVSNGSLLSQDTDVRGSNAIDLITGAAWQAAVMDWTKGPVVAPYVTRRPPFRSARSDFNHVASPTESTTMSAPRLFVMRKTSFSHSIVV